MILSPFFGLPPTPGKQVTGSFLLRRKQNLSRFPSHVPVFNEAYFSLYFSAISPLFLPYFSQLTESSANGTQRFPLGRDAQVPQLVQS